MTLTDRQAAILRYLGEYVEVQGYPPTVREVARQFGISVGGAHKHLLALERAGHVRREPGSHRGIAPCGG